VARSVSDVNGYNLYYFRTQKCTKPSGMFSILTLQHSLFLSPHVTVTGVCECVCLSVPLLLHYIDIITRGSVCNGNAFASFTLSGLNLGTQRQQTPRLEFCCLIVILKSNMERHSGTKEPALKLMVIICIHIDCYIICMHIDCCIKFLREIQMCAPVVRHT